MTRPRILVAGVGNIFLGDDAFGVAVVDRLMREALPPAVRVVDFGIRGLDLTYALLDGYEAVILVDAVPRGGLPGTLYLIEATLDDGQGAVPLVEGHGMDPVKVLRLAASLGAKVDRLLVVGCEPATSGEAEDEMRDGLSAPVLAAVDEAVRLVSSLTARLLLGARIEANGDHFTPSVRRLDDVETDVRLS